jgi:dienelactone hydrolase
MMDDKYLARIWISVIVLIGFCMGGIFTCSMHRNTVAARIAIEGGYPPAEAMMAVSNQVPSAEILGLRALDALSKNK